MTVEPHTEHKGNKFILNLDKTGQFTLCVFLCVSVCALMEFYSNYSKYTQNHPEFIKFEVY
jgi:hypothetical protein